MREDHKKQGKVIKDIRNARCLTQKDLAKATNLSVTYLSMLENGRKTMSPKALNAISTVLDIAPQCVPILSCSGTQNKLVNDLTDTLKEALWAELKKNAKLI